MAATIRLAVTRRLLDPAARSRPHPRHVHPPGFRPARCGAPDPEPCASDAAAKEGFARVELAGTLSGEPLYRQAGYAPIRHFEDDRGGAPVPLILMGKTLIPHASATGLTASIAAAFTSAARGTRMLADAAWIRSPRSPAGCTNIA